VFDREIESWRKFVSSVLIDLRRLAIVYSVAILAPLTIGFLVELWIDVDFSLIVVAGFVSLPLVVFFVCRTALAEMERVVQMVAPSEEEESNELIREGPQQPA
jgi:hypothetical protein